MTLDQEYVIQSGGTQYRGNVFEIGEFNSLSEGKIAGRDISLRVDDPGFAGRSPGLSIPVLGEGAVEETVAVPSFVCFRSDEPNICLSCTLKEQPLF